MKYGYAIALFAVAFIIQTTLMNVIGINGATPNLLLCLVVILSFLFDERNYGLVLGMVFGLLYDICFSQYVGVAALSFLVISLSVMIINFFMNKETVFSVITISVGATVIYSLFYWGVMAMLGSGYSFLYMLKNLPLYILYNTAVVTMLYYLMIKKVIRYHYDRYYK